MSYSNSTTIILNPVTTSNIVVLPAVTSGLPLVTLVLSAVSSGNISLKFPVTFSNISLPAASATANCGSLISYEIDTLVIDVASRAISESLIPSINTLIAGVSTTASCGSLIYANVASVFASVSCGSSATTESISPTLIIAPTATSASASSEGVGSIISASASQASSSSITGNLTPNVILLVPNLTILCSSEQVGISVSVLSPSISAVVSVNPVSETIFGEGIPLYGKSSEFYLKGMMTT